MVAALAPLLRRKASTQNQKMFHLWQMKSSKCLIEDEAASRPGCLLAVWQAKPMSEVRVDVLFFAAAREHSGVDQHTVVLPPPTEQQVTVGVCSVPQQQRC